MRNLDGDGPRKGDRDPERTGGVGDISVWALLVQWWSGYTRAGEGVAWQSSVM